MSKGCSCDFWNKEQQECLYHGTCVQDEKPVVGTSFINLYKNNIQHLGGKEDTLIFILQEMLKELGFEIKEG